VYNLIHILLTIHSLNLQCLALLIVLSPFLPHCFYLCSLLLYHISSLLQNKKLTNIPTKKVPLWTLYFYNYLISLVMVGFCFFVIIYGFLDGFLSFFCHFLVVYVRTVD